MKMTKLLNEDQLHKANQRLKKERAKLREERKELRYERMQIGSYIDKKARERSMAMARRHVSTMMISEIMNEIGEYARWKAIQASATDISVFNMASERVIGARSKILHRYDEIEEKLGCQGNKIIELEEQLKAIRKARKKGAENEA